MTSDLKMSVGLIFLLFVGGYYSQAQIKSYIGTYNYQGVPDYLVSPGDNISQSFLDRIDAAVPEYYPVPTYHPSYLTDNFQASVEIVATTEVFITFVNEGAGYKNVLGFYHYATGNPPDQSSDVDTIFIAFPNVSRAGSGGGLYPGDKVSIGTFNPGTTIGFALIANAYSSGSNSVGNGLWTLFSDKNINPNTDPHVRQQTVVLYDGMTDKYAICFEDIKRPSGDKDFNDAIFYVTTSVAESISESDIASLPCIWEGTVDSNWFNVANWNPPMLPDSVCNVSISALAPHAPKITGEVEIDAVTIDPGAGLVVDDEATFRLKGDFTDVNSDFTSGSVKLVGEKTQHIFGSPEFTKLEVASSDTVIIEEEVSVTKSLDVSSGVLVTNNQLRLVNDNSGDETASANEQLPGIIDGEITVETTIPTPHGYHYLSSPVQGQTLADINDDYTLIGLGGDLTTAPFPNMWIYDETVVSTHNTDGWATPTSLTHTMDPGEGFAFYVDAGTVIDLKGEPNTGTIEVPLTHTQVPDDGQDHSMCPPDGWQLIGNPYPTPIDWDKALLKNIEDGIYLWDPFYHHYATYVDGVGVNGGSKNIATMQGFFVRTNREDSTITASVTFADSMKLSAEQNVRMFRSVADTLLRLKLNGPHGGDEIAVKFTEHADENFDSDKDAYKLKNQSPTVPNFASFSGNNEQIYSINSMPAISVRDTIGLYIEAGSAGTYEIEIDPLSTFSSIGNVWILDADYGVTYALTSMPFSFNLTEEQETERYKIIIDLQSETTDIEALNSPEENLHVLINNESILISSATHIDNARINLISVNGQVVLTSAGEKIDSTPLMLETQFLSEGVYFVNIQTEQSNVTRKVLLTNR